MSKIYSTGSNQPYVIQGKIFSSKRKERREISSFGRKTAVIKDRDMNPAQIEQLMKMLKRQQSAE